MTAAPHALRRLGAVALTLALAATVLISPATESHAQSSPEFSDLDETVHADAIRLVAEDGITRGFPDGTFRPREDVRRDQMATFVAAALQLPPRTPNFPDVDTDGVHAGAIGAIAHADITRGFPDGTYGPREFVTRGQMATFLAKGLELAPGRATFSDVPSSYVHAEAISALADSGITEGFPDGTFRPNALVKRDQMAAFLARGIPLPRVPECPGSDTASTSASTSSTETTDDSSTEQSGEATTSTQDSTTVDRDSEDLLELESGDLLAPAERGLTADANQASKQDLGPAIPGIAFPLTSVIRTSGGNLEVHSQDLTTSRGGRVDAAGDVTATTTIPAGRRTWATARIGDDVYAGQWGVPAGNRNLYRYSTTASGDRVATAVATVPTGNEFWALTRDSSGRLWAGTRAHADAAFRDTIGLGNGRGDGRHVVHRIAPSTGRVTNVTICLPDPPGTAAGLRPDIKQLATVGPTLYVGTGQQSGGARLFAVEPGNRDDIPAGEVRDLTPPSVRSATGVFSLATTDKWIAFGTQASSGQAARLVVIHRASEATRINMPLTDESDAGESRIDAVAIDGDRIVATGFSGTVYDVTASTSGSVRTRAPLESERIEPPVDDQFHRYVEIQGNSLRGVTQQGVVWTRAANGDVDRVNLVDTGAPVAPGLPHSLYVGSQDVAVGASSAITLRPAASPEDESRTVNITGEAKAMTSDAAGNTYVATYPNAGLWRIDAGGDAAELRRSWTANFRRPADADFDDRPVGGRVNVIARDDNAPMSESRPAPQANFQYRPSRLFSMNPTLTSRASGFPLGRAGTLTSPVSAEASAATPVEASAIHNGTDPAGTEVYIGDTRGGVQRVNASNGERQWYRNAPAEDRYRRIVDIQLVDDRLVVVLSGALLPRGGGDPYEHRTVVRELNPENGAQISRSVVRTSSGGSFAVGDAVTSGDVTVMTTRSSLRYFDRSTETHFGQAFDHRNDSFGGPYVDIDRTACQLYSFERTPSHLVRQPPPGVFEEAACPSGIDLPIGDDS